MHPHDGDEDCFQYDERHTTAVGDIVNKAVAEYEAKHACKVKRRSDSPYVRLQDRSRHPQQGSIVNEARTAGDLLKIFKQKHPSVLKGGFWRACAYYLGLWGATSTISRVPLHVDLVCD